MPAKVMDGRVVAQVIRSKIKDEVDRLRERHIEPNLVTVIVGDNPASRAYLASKQSAFIEAGIRKSRNIELGSKTSQEELERIIRDLDRDTAVTGILLQLPLPGQLNEVEAISTIAPEKDVDGLNPCNLGKLAQKGAKLAPCTPLGIIVLLKYYRVQIAGRHAVLINRSKLVGRPLSQLLLNEDATVTICHSKTQNLSALCRQGDILLTGIGRRPNFVVGPDMIKPEAAVVDIGTSSVGGKLVGDVDFDAAMHVASFLSPVPGGVGPMTTSMLLYNSLLTACMQTGVEMKVTLDESASYGAP